MLLRLSRWVDKTLRYLNWFEIPHLSMVLAAIPILGFALESMGYPKYHYAFDPTLILQGEIWRLLAIPMSSISPFWLIFYVLYIYYLVDAIEGAWGTSKLSVFVAFCYLCSVGAGFIFNSYVSVWYFVMLNITLAFGTIFPNIEFYLYFILRVKAKWISILAAVLLVWSFLVASVVGRCIIGMAVFPYLLFFGPQLLLNLKNEYKNWKRKRDFQNKL